MSLDVHDRGDLKRSRKLHKRRAKHAKAKITRWQRVRQQALKLVARRNRQLKALDRQNDPAAKAAKFLLDRVGCHEDPGRPNRAVWLDKWARLIGSWMIGQPWCGLAVWMAARYAGVTLDKTTVSTVAIRDMAQRGVGGFKAWHPASASPQVGWVPVYGTPGSGPQHTGMYVGGGRIAEGNTSPGAGGSQNNGGGLYVRTLAERRGWLLGWAEIDWKQAKR